MSSSLPSIMEQEPNSAEEIAILTHLFRTVSVFEMKSNWYAAKYLKDIPNLSIEKIQLLFLQDKHCFNLQMDLKMAAALKKLVIEFADAKQGRVDEVFHKRFTIFPKLPLE